jgi:hypothetical protein
MKEKEDANGDGSGSEIHVRYSPKFARSQRRSILVSGSLGVVASIVCLMDAFNAIRNHTLVDMGPASGHVHWPPSLVIAMGLFLLICSVWILLRSGARQE